MVRMRSVRHVAGPKFTAIRRRGLFVVSSNSRRLPVRVETSDVDSAALWHICGVFASVATAFRRPVETAICSRSRTDCCRACWRGLNANADCSRTWINRDCDLSCACSCSRICRDCGRACLVLKMTGNTLPPLLPQSVTPALKLRGDSLDAGGLFNGPHFDARGVLVRGRDSGGWITPSPVP